MISVNLIDKQFPHGTSLGSGDLKIYPKNLTWDRTCKSNSKHVFITEDSFASYDFYKNPMPVSWIIEPPLINKEAYRFAKKNESKFAFILSHNKDFLATISNGLYYPFGGCWIEEADRKVYPKTKLISIIASGKKETIGHRLRHEVIAKFGGQIDVFGHGYNPIDSKLEALKDYAYTIVIENEQGKGWFTEKLIDALQCGCIPVYWGAPDIYSYLDNVKGLFNIEYLDQMLAAEVKEPGCLLNYYNQDLERVNKLFTLSKKYTCPEDYIFNTYNFLFNNGTQTHQ